MAIKKIQQVLKALDKSIDDVEKQEKIIKDWGRSIVQSCTDRASIHCQEVQMSGMEIDVEELEGQINDVKNEL